MWAELVGCAMMVAATLMQPAAAQSQQHIDWCVNANHGFSYDQQISGCTAAIASGKWSGQGLAWAYNNRSFANYLRGDRDRAYADFDQAIQLDPKDAQAFNNRGLAYYASNDLDRAIAEFNEAIRLDPKNAFAFNNRGGAYRDKNEYDRAIIDYSEAIRLQPTFVVALNGRANAYKAKGDIDRALDDYSEAIRLRPDYALAFNGLGNAYQARGDFDQAIASFNQAIRLNAKYDVAFNGRGIAYQAKGEPERAIADYSEAISGSISNSPWPSTTAATPTTQWATSIAPSRTTPRRSGSIQTTLDHISIAAMRRFIRGRCLRPRPTSIDRASSIPNTLSPLFGVTSRTSAAMYQAGSLRP